MKCFVIAMDKEAAPVIAAMKVESDSKKCGKRVICGGLFGEKVGVVVCGVGKVNAACGAQMAIDLLGADTVINLGVAGGLNGSVEIGKVYAVSAAVQYDFDLTQLNGTKIGTLDECKDNYLPLSLSDAYPPRKVGTGDRFNDDKADYELLTSYLGADIREMECAAIAQVCMHAEVPFFAFKAISDLAGKGSTTEQFLNNLDLCFKNIALELETIVKSAARENL